jgi:hypothetical protein
VRRRPGLPPIIQYTTKGLHPTRLPVSITDLGEEQTAPGPDTTGADTTAQPDDA